MNFDNKNKPKGLKRILTAYRNSCNGIIWLMKRVTAFQQELLISIVLSILTFFLEISQLERVLLLVSLLLILLIEILNTSIEVVVDRIGLEINPLSGLAKDLGSAAVFTSFVIAIVVWGGILWL